MKLPRFHLPVVLAPLLVALVGCTTAAGAGPAVSDAWIRASTGGQTPTAGYLVITNPGDQADALVGASSSFAASVEIHETSADASGMMAMHPVARVEIPAGATVRLEPGGYHLMLMGLTQPVEAGSTIELELVFERAGKVRVQADVRQG